MKIELQKFGSTLVSRPAGRDAYLAYQASLPEIGADEKITFDFLGVDVLTPSWADEFITPFVQRYPKRVEFENTENLSVKVTLETLQKVWK